MTYGKPETVCHPEWHLGLRPTKVDEKRWRSAALQKVGKIQNSC